MRISPKLIRQALLQSRLLPPLLRPNKSLQSAQNELSWIKQELPKLKWKQAVARRSHHEPLQYILGTQPFGDLEIICKPGVLIPRWETEEWTLKLAQFLINKTTPVTSPLRILDVCTGTGCIPLLLSHQLSAHGINHIIEGIDVSPLAISLATENSDKFDIDVKFSQHDLFTWNPPDAYDIIVSNPPYVSYNDYNSSEVETSVRLYEPLLALVGYLEFYTALVENVVLCTGCKLFIFELGSENQLEHVICLLPSGWLTKELYDSAGNLRCIMGVLRDSEYEEVFDYI